jgi:hypothetical protein
LVTIGKNQALFIVLLSLRIKAILLAFQIEFLTALN